MPPGACLRWTRLYEVEREAKNNERHNALNQLWPGGNAGSFFVLNALFALCFPFKYPQRNLLFSDFSPPQQREESKQKKKKKQPTKGKRVLLTTRVCV